MVGKAKIGPYQRFIDAVIDAAVHECANHLRLFFGIRHCLGIIADMDAYIMARHQLQKPLIRYDCTVCYDADLTDAAGISAAQMRQDFIKLRMQEPI